MHSVFDGDIKVAFDRQKLKDASSVETKFVRMHMMGAWGKPIDLPAMGKVIVRKIPNVGESHVPFYRLTSHTKKRSASEATGHSGALWGVLMAMQKSANRETAMMYHMKESVEYTPIRQLLNAPAGLLPSMRVVSQLDVLQQLKITEARLFALQASEVHPYLLTCMHHYAYTHGILTLPGPNQWHPCTSSLYAIVYSCIQECIHQMLCDVHGYVRLVWLNPAHTFHSCLCRLPFCSSR